VKSAPGSSHVNKSPRVGSHIDKSARVGRHVNKYPRVGSHTQNAQRHSAANKQRVAVSKKDFRSKPRWRI
jgi:hypothetical protein